MAELAGIGVDWYIRLEQGRSVCPSVTTIDALARALRLNKVEHAHLRALTRNPDRRAFRREIVTESIRRVGVTWADEARRMVAQFRMTHDLWAGDPAFMELLERLRRGCPEFAIWWEAHDIRNVGAGRKVLTHPTKGALHFEYATFQANDDPALKLAIYAPL